MPPRRATKPAATLELPPVLDINAAAPLHRALADLRGKSLALDASNVQRIGGQCLQVLLAAFSAWGADKKPLSIAAPSKAFEDGLSLLGFSVETLSTKDSHR